MYELYYCSGTCSMAVHVVLEELGVEFKINEVDLWSGEHQQPEFLKINPRGQVSALVTPEGVLTENAAIIIYLNDKHGGKLLAEGEFDRAKALQWLMFANSGLHGAYAKCMFSMRNGASDEVIKLACDGVQEQWNHIEAQLERADTQYLVGDAITAGDIYVGVVANWQFIPHLPTFGPKTQALIDAVSAMPSFQAVIKREEVDYKVAA